MTEKEKEKLLAYFKRISLQLDSDVQQALSASSAKISVYNSECLVRASIERRIIDKMCRDLFILLDI